MNAYTQFESSLKLCANKVALVSGIGRGRRAVSFHELNEQIDAVASQLVANGLTAGDRVLLAVPMSIQTYVVMLALMKAGMITMFIDPGQPAAQVAQILRSWPPAAIVSVRSILLFRFLMPELRKIRKRFVVDSRSAGATTLLFADSRATRFVTTKRSPADSALLTFTSGSTGEPKPVLRTHSFLRQQLKVLDEIADVRRDDVDYVAMPMFVLFNLAKAITSIIPVADMKRPGRADPSLLYEQMRDERVTRAVASPALLERLANYCLVNRLNLPEMRCISTGGGPVSPLLAGKIRRIAPASIVRMVYGSTEAEPIASLDDSDVSIDDRQRMGRGEGLLVGRPVRGCAVKIIRSRPGVPVDACSKDAFKKQELASGEIGEITVCGDHVMKGYADSSRNQTTKIEVDGTIWHRTGDAGYFDESGRLWLVGRSAAAIQDRRGTIYPFQVEYAVSAVNGIRRAALIECNNQRLLVLETADREILSGCASAARCVAKFDIDRIVTVRRIPMDKRHDAKIDYPALRQQLKAPFPRIRFLLIGSISSVFGAARSILRQISRLLARGFVRFCTR